MNNELVLYQAVSRCRALRREGIGLIEAAREAAAMFDVPQRTILTLAMNAEEGCTKAYRCHNPESSPEY